MKPNRWTSAGLSALLLLSTAAPATAALTSKSPAAASDARASVKKASRAYGDGPVTLNGQSARISFRGQKGDIVHLDTGSSAKGSKTRLLLNGRRIAASWDYFWTLPRSGRFVFSFRAAAGDDPGRRLQLQKLRIAKTKLDARPVAGRTQPRGYLNAVSVDLRDGERALLTSKDYRHTVLAPGGHQEHLFGSDLQLEVGRPIHTTIGDLADTELAAGSLIVLGGGTKPTRVTRSVVQAIPTDGTVMEFTSDAKPREYVFTFDGAVGDVVIPDFHGTSRWSRVFQAPDGYRQEVAPLSGAYWFFDAGTARYSVITNGRSGTTTKLSVTKALNGPAVANLDTPITLTNTKPGQYVAVSLPPYPSPAPVGLTATDAAFTTTDGSTPTWSVHLEPDAPTYCLADPHAPLGCGEYYPLTVDENSASDALESLYGYTGNSLVLAVPPTASGSVTISLQKPAQG